MDIPLSNYNSEFEWVIKWKRGGFYVQWEDGVICKYFPSGLPSPRFYCDNIANSNRYQEAVGTKGDELAHPINQTTHYP